MKLSVAGFGLLLTALAVGSLAGAAVAAWLILTGLSMVVFSVIAAVSLRQGIVPDRLLGRVNAATAWSPGGRSRLARHLAA